MTRDIMRQDEATGPELSPGQDRAIAELLSGSSVTAAAEAAGVSRSSVHRWLADDPAFIAAYNLARQEVRDAARRDLDSLAVQAVGCVRSLMAGPETPAAVTLRAALEVIKSASEGTIGPTCTEDAEVAIAKR